MKKVTKNQIIHTMDAEGYSFIVIEDRKTHQKTFPNILDVIRGSLRTQTFDAIIEAFPGEILEYQKAIYPKSILLALREDNQVNVQFS